MDAGGSDDYARAGIPDPAGSLPVKRHYAAGEAESMHRLDGKSHVFSGIAASRGTGQ